MSKIPLSTGINLLQHTLGLKLSKEQLNVLKYDYKTPVLLNSCAGAGKTTLLIISVLMQIITSQESPDQIIGITFSRKARLNMQKKYRKCISDLSTIIPNAKNIREPKFTTFHALFFHLLEKIQSLHVLSSYTYILMDLMKAMKVHPKFKSSAEIIKLIFQFRSRLIDYQYSWDGLNLRDRKSDVSSLKRIAEELGDSHSDDFYANYFSVVKKYIDYKHEHNLIDFNDMKIDLYKAMGNSKKSAIIKKAMAGYKICFIDEFQDIDPIQWKLIKMIMPKSALHHLAAIGDDDQSIYAFRGSDPDIILNFKKNVPHTKVFNLTTNYRTAENVLSAVKPLIQKNQYRLGKPLNAYRKKTGKITCFRGNKYSSGGELMLQNLLKKINNPKIDNRKIAVLCRYNLDETFAVDWLANHQLYVPVTKRNILQNNYMYRIFYDLMKALYLDRFSLFRKHAKRIGFYSYLIHIKWVLANHGLTSVHRLSKYIRLADDFDRRYKKQIKKYKKGGYSIRNDHKLAAAFKKVHSTYDHHAVNTGQLLFDNVDQLTEDYFDFMNRHNYINSSLYGNVNNYLDHRMAHVSDPIAFFKQENTKKDILSHPSDGDSNDINVITIHQSKGLQFDYVYLYNLRDQDVKTMMVTMNYLFAPNISRLGFLRKLLNLLLSTKKLQSIGDDKELYLLAVNVMGFIDDLVKYKNHVSKKRASHKTSRKALNKQYKHNEDTAITKADSLFAKDIQSDHDDQVLHQFNDDYRDVVSKSHTVEEERRLVYVALTRTIKAAYYNADSNQSPLLKELKISNKNIVSADRDGKVDNRASQLHSDGLSSKQMDQIERVFDNFI